MSLKILSTQRNFNFPHDDIFQVNIFVFYVSPWGPLEIQRRCLDQAREDHFHDFFFSIFIFRFLCFFYGYFLRLFCWPIWQKYTTIFFAQGIESVSKHGQKPVRPFWQNASQIENTGFNRIKVYLWGHLVSWQVLCVMFRTADR